MGMITAPRPVVPQGAMAMALSAAGYKPVGERLLDALLFAFDRPETIAQPELERPNPRQLARLEEAALAAIKQSPRNWDGAKDALYKLVRNDADLLWEMFQKHRSTEAHRLLTEAAATYRAAELAKESIRALPSQGSGAGQFINERHDQAARPARKSSAGIAAIAAVAQASLLDTFRINGRPIGDLTAIEATQWAAARERDARFVRMLTANLPADAPIRKFRTADDAAAIFAQAEEAEHA